MDKEQVKNDEKNAQDLKQSFAEIDSRDRGNEKPIQIDINDNPAFTCPDFVLDFLQDKPIVIQKMLISSDLNPSQRKKIEHIFRANEHEIKVNREAIKNLIEETCRDNPKLIPLFSTKTIFFATFGFGYYERKNLVEEILASDKKNEVE